MQRWWIALFLTNNLKMRLLRPQEIHVAITFILHCTADITEAGKGEL